MTISEGRRRPRRLSAETKWAGYVNYPNTCLRDDEKALLLESSFITRP